VNLDCLKNCGLMRATRPVVLPHETKSSQLASKDPAKPPLLATMMAITVAS